MKSRRRLHLLAGWGIFVVAVLFTGASSSWAQSATTGALTGAVTDSQGAPVPSVAVTLSSTATGQMQTTMTGSNGLYGFSQLPPGAYEVDFSAKGFKTSRALSVVVDVSEAPALNAQLEAGSSDESVPCKCQLTQTASASSGTLVDRKTITAVPLTTRNFTQVMSMSAGSAAGVNNASLLGTGSQSANVNGNTAAGTFTVDGATSASTVPNPDTIAEFKIQTSQYDAGYGAWVPNTNLITRSGENSLHGDLWEFVRNDALNANAFFQNALGQPKPNLKQNQFGGTLGGPIKKDKIFFFGSYQGTRQVNGLDPSSLATMTLPPLTNNRSAASIGSEFCPANHGPAFNNAFNTFAGGPNGVGTQVACNGSNINPVALALLQAKLPNGSYVIPTPQNITTAIGGNGVPYSIGTSSFSLPSTYNEDQYVANVDYLISKNQTLSARYYYADSDTFRQLGANLFTSSATPNVPGFPQNSPAVDYMTSAKLSSVVTSNLVNEARFTFTRTYSTGTGPNDLTTASIGMATVDPFLPLAPDITIQGPLGGFKVGNAQNQVENGTNTYTWADNLSWVHGRHTIRTGFFAVKQTSLLFDTGPARGKVVFQNFTDFLVGQSAAANGSPTGLSNIYSIDAKEGSGPSGQILYGTRTVSFASFVADDIKVTPRFTLDLGLRWEFFPAATDTTNDQGSTWPSLLSLMPIPPVSGTYIGTTIPSSFNPNQINPYTGQPFGPPPAGVFVRPNAGYYQNSAPIDTFAPRLGFAWQPRGQQGRIAVRGGYGWFYQTANANGNGPNFPLVNMQPYAQLFENTAASNGASTLQQPFPTTTLGYVLRTPTSQLTDRILGPTYKIPALQQWNLNVQYSLAKTLSLDIGYVGSYADHLLVGFGSNQPVLASAANPVNCGLPGGCITTNTATNAALRVPYVGETPSALVSSQFIGASWYHSMQATLRKQISHGLMFQVAYTYSKSLSDTTADNNQTDLHLDWARTSFDRTHRVISNFNYDLPSLGANGFVGKASSGWSLTGIIIVQSGLPITLMDFAGGTVYGNAGPSTATICPGMTYANLVTSGSTTTRLNNWFNTSAVCPAAVVGSDGIATAYGNTGQSIVNGPGQFNTDFSVGKTTTVGGVREGAQLAFRVEFYNALNHPQFSNPGSVVGTSTFGVIQQTAVGPRLIQFGLKYLF
jgi:hypothetical protein